MMRCGLHLAMMQRICAGAHLYATLLLTPMSPARVIGTCAQADGVAWEVAHGDEEKVMRHLNTILHYFYAVDCLPNTAGSRLGILRTLYHMIKQLEPQLNAKRYLVLVSDLGVSEKIKHMVFSSTPWETLLPPSEMLDCSESGKLDERLSRVRAGLVDCMESLGELSIKTQKVLLADMNAVLRDAHEAEKEKREAQMEEGELLEEAAVPTVDKGTLSKFLQGKHRHGGGAFLRRAELYLRLKRAAAHDVGAQPRRARAAGAAGAMDTDDDDDDGAADDDDDAPPEDELEDEEAPDLKVLRSILTERLFALNDTFHINMHLNKFIYEKFRRVLFKFLFSKIFPKGKALRGRKLVTIKFLFLLLRLATTQAVRGALCVWYDEELETGVSDPRAELLLVLLLVYLPVVALWERAALHGPVTLLEELSPLIVLVRVCVCVTLWLALLRVRAPAPRPADALRRLAHRRSTAWARPRTPRT